MAALLVGRRRMAPDPCTAGTPVALRPSRAARADIAALAARPEPRCHPRHAARVWPRSRGLPAARPMAAQAG